MKTGIKDWKHMVLRCEKCEKEITKEEANYYGDQCPSCWDKEGKMMTRTDDRDD